MNEKNVDLLVHLLKMEKAIEMCLTAVKSRMTLREWQTACERFARYFEQ
jgi:hypothetical protein